MDNVAERETDDTAAQRREAVRAAQKSSTNIFLFRGLKWGAPRGGKGPPPAPPKRFSPIDLLLWLLALSAVGLLVFAALSVNGAVNPPAFGTARPASHQPFMMP